jgi:thiamine biosynthesis protein ThiS
MMEILLNGAAYQIENSSNITALLEQLELSGKRLAVEVNTEIIPRSQFTSYTLTAGDKVEIVHAIGGG